MQITYSIRQMPHKKTVQWTVRAPQELDKKLTQIIKTDCNENKSTFIRKAVMEKLKVTEYDKPL